MTNPTWHDLAFYTLESALWAGFHVYDKTHFGFLVRRKRADEKWELALVDVTITKPPRAVA